MEGNLYKWTNIVSRWKMRYFYIQRGVLKYSKKQGQKQLGFIPLQFSLLYIHNRNPRRILINTGVFTVHLKGTTVDEVKIWFEALVSAQSESESIPSFHSISGRSTKWSSLLALQKELENWCDAPGANAKFLEFAREFTQKAREIFQKEESDSDCSEQFFDAVGELPEDRDSRTSLPVPRQPNENWTISQLHRGAKLAFLDLPLHLYEPLSYLQRITEDLTYNEVLLTAFQCHDSLLRLALVACFSLSAYSNTQSRTLLAFTPLLGETFELVKDGFKYISEQVESSPPTTALHCIHPVYKYYGNIALETEVKPNSVIMRPVGTLHLVFPKYDDHYLWSKPVTSIKNLARGKTYVEHSGAYTVTNVNTYESCAISLQSNSLFRQGLSRKVQGQVRDDLGNITYTITGHWDSEIVIVDSKTNSEIHRLIQKPTLEDSCHFTEFALQLNQPPTSTVPVTDSRHRPDIRALEGGVISPSQQSNENLLSPQYFGLNTTEWVYNGTYW